MPPPPVPTPPAGSTRGDAQRMMRNMGWHGGGLGRTEQGRRSPVREDGRPAGDLTGVGFVRVAAFGTAPLDTLAITASLLVISFSSVVLGAALPLLLERLAIDAAHASTTIQVVMDISGVLIVCAISQAIFSSGLSLPPLGGALFSPGAASVAVASLGSSADTLLSF